MIMKQKLKKRIYVKNAIGSIKKNERIMTRKDHKIINYLIKYVNLNKIT